MYIVAIAWIYVVFMMSITEESVVAGVMTFALYGILPLTIILYIMGTPQRKRRRAEIALARLEAVRQPDEGSLEDEPGPLQPETRSTTETDNKPNAGG